MSLIIEYRATEEAIKELYASGQHTFLTPTPKAMVST